MKISRTECVRRTIAMIANFLHQKASDIRLAQDLRKDWKMLETDFIVLETWIEGPIGKLEGYFQDVKADVSLTDLQNSKLKTVKDLVGLIWNSIPEQNKKS